MEASFLLLLLAVGCLAYMSRRQLLKRILATQGSSRPVSSNGEKKQSDGDYSRTFPPSQRHTLFQLMPTASKPVNNPPMRDETLLKMESDYRLAHLSTTVYSGFTVGDIRNLGNFPCYTTLSEFPAPAPLEDFNLDTARPRPYRPFRWPYHQTMSLSKLDPDYWLELESTYRDRLAQRQDLYIQHGKSILQALPGSQLACKELMEMALQFLSIRYPQQFAIRDNVLMNHIMDTKHDLTGADPLHVLLENVPEDFGIMLRDETTGRYHLRAGVICSSLGWKLGEKIGMGLPGVHQAVPSYKEKMAFSMDRFFTKMPSSNPIQRGSWGLEIGQPLFLPTDHPDWSNRDSQRTSLCEEDIYLRVDWQTLRRLPLSGAIVFNFKALYTPLREFADEPYIPSLVLKILNEGEEGIMKYKGTWHVEHIVKPALKKYEEAQLQKGLIEKDWSVRTLDETPFFPGWQRKHK